MGGEGRGGRGGGGGGGTSSTISPARIPFCPGTNVCAYLGRPLEGLGEGWRGLGPGLCSNSHPDCQTDHYRLSQGLRSLCSECMYVCMYVCVCTHVCVYVCMYVCVYVHIWECVYVQEEG